MPDLPPSRRRSIIWILRFVVLALVAFGVSGTVRNALGQLSQHEWHVKPAWLIAAGIIYVVALVPMAWFWHRALATLGQPAPWRASLRAYFVGHLGKYVPGKALSVILRVAAVQKWVSSIRIAIVCSILETLMLMSVGAFIAAVLSIFVLRLEPAISAIAVAMAVVVGLPTLPPVARFLARIGAARFKQPPAAENGSLPTAPRSSDDGLDGIDWRLFVAGWCAASVCWVLFGLSLWMILHALGVDALQPVADLPRLVAAVALAVVAGFASMLPGGLVVRDALLMELLSPSCGPANALVAAVLMRLVWLVSEFIVCVILYVATKNR